VPSVQLVGPRLLGHYSGCGAIFSEGDIQPMPPILFAIGMLWLIAGTLTFMSAVNVWGATAASQLPNIGVVATLLLSFGMVFLAFATIIDRIEKLVSERVDRLASDRLEKMVRARVEQLAADPGTAASPPR
jgi:hypothetical protein